MTLRSMTKNGCEYILWTPDGANVPSRKTVSFVLWSPLHFVEISGTQILNWIWKFCFISALSRCLMKLILLLHNVLHLREIKCRASLERKMFRHWIIWFVTRPIQCKWKYMFAVFNVELWQIKSVLVTKVVLTVFPPKNKRTLNPVNWLYIPIFVIHMWALLHIQYNDFWNIAVGIFFTLQQLSDQRHSWHCGLTWNSGKYASDKIPACRYVPVLVWNRYLVPHSSGKIDFYQPYLRPLTPYWLHAKWPPGLNPSGWKNESCCC